MMNTDTPDVTGGHAGGDRGISPALDATLDLLSNRRRRYVLYCLREQGGGATVEELADRLATWESDDEQADPERIHTDLYHSQLPRLEEAGAVSFDAESGYVSLSEDPDGPLAEYLDIAAREENVV